MECLGSRRPGVFDITKVIVGSQGTFGMLTEAKLRLVPLKKHSRLCVVFLKDLAPVARSCGDRLAVQAGEHRVV